MSPLDKAERRATDEHRRGRRRDLQLTAATILGIVAWLSVVAAGVAAAT